MVLNLGVEWVGSKQLRYKTITWIQRGKGELHCLVIPDDNKFLSLLKIQAKFKRENDKKLS